MRTAITALFIFLFVLTLLMAAYSVNIPLVSVDPVAAKPEMVYVLDKNFLGSDRNEVRSVTLTLSGTTVSGATVVFYKRTGGTYYVRTTVMLLDEGGSTISTGTVCGFYTGTGLRTAIITGFSPPVSIDEVYRVNVEIARVSFALCFA
jgi:hypothetical protein